MKNVMFAGLLTLTYPALANDCFEMAGRDYNIDPDLLRTISFRESSLRPEAINVITNKNYAIGMMQIHSQNFSHLAQFGITPSILYKDQCMNIYTGAYFLAIAFDRWGTSWDAVGAYNAGFKKNVAQEKKRQKYALEVHRIYIEYKKTKNTQNILFSSHFVKSPKSYETQFNKNSKSDRDQKR